jgi:glycosyltransferase involved in cell wall biosynthesis
MPKIMKIGIDAKWYFTGPISAQTVLHNLLPKLFELYPMHEWILFLDKKDKGLDFPFKQSNINLKYVWANNNFLSNLFLLPRHTGKGAIDVMVFQTFPSFVSNTCSIAFIHDVLFRHYPQFFTWKERLYFLPLPWLTPNAKRLIATTEYVAGDLVKYKYARDRSQIDIVPLGVSTEFKPMEQHKSNFLEQVRKKFKLPESYILFVGRLNVRKNIENLLRSLPGLENNTIRLVVVGKEDSKTPYLKDILSDPAISKRILFTGSMNNQELAATYAMATIFCFPSFAEGFGLPPLEAMASGIPVVVSNTTALAEVCGNAPLYMNPAQPASITKAMNELLGNPELYNEKKISGLQRAAEYNWSTTAHTFMQSVYNAHQKKSL